ncbi:MAG: hypothetical protein ACKVI4_14195 [Actinomycetales bacterium]
MARRGYPRLPESAAVGEFYATSQVETYKLNENGGRDPITQKVYQANSVRLGPDATFRLPYKLPKNDADGAATRFYGYRVYDAFALWGWLQNSPGNVDPSDPSTKVTREDFMELRARYDPNYLVGGRTFRNMPADWMYAEFEGSPPPTQALVDSLMAQVNTLTVQEEALEEQVDTLEQEARVARAAGGDAAAAARIAQLQATLATMERERDAARLDLRIAAEMRQRNADDRDRAMRERDNNARELRDANDRENAAQGMLAQTRLERDRAVVELDRTVVERDNLRAEQLKQLTGSYGYRQPPRDSGAEALRELNEMSKDPF